MNTIKKMPNIRWRGNRLFMGPILIALVKNQSDSSSGSWVIRSMDGCWRYRGWHTMTFPTARLARIQASKRFGLHVGPDKIQS